MIDMNRRSLLQAMAASAAALPSTVQAEPTRRFSHATIAKARQVMQRAFATLPAPALSMAVAGEDELHWAEAMGQADLERGVAAAPSHLFALGSVSKLLTATVAAKLAIRRKIDLDAPITRWMPSLPEQHHGTTLRMLLTHRGGIRHYNKAEPDLGSAMGAIYMRLYPTDADVLRLFINDPLVAPPGSEVQYSSYGYTLASMVMAAAAGQPFLDLIKQEIAGPYQLLSLKPDDPWSIVEARAAQYMNDLDIRTLCATLPQTVQPRMTDGWANLPFNNPAYCWAGAGFLMTPSDAARFGAAMLPSSNAPLTRDERALLFTPMTAATKSSPPLGLGWRIDRDKSNRLRWHHAGATPGGCFLLAVYPEQQLAVSLAGNVMTMKLNVLQTAADLLDAFASGWATR